MSRKSCFGENIPWWKDAIYYPLIRTWNRIESIPREIKWFVQRGYRGYADCDCWNIDNHLADIIPKMLRQLSKYNHGCPDAFTSNDPEFNCDKWDKKLIEMAEGFEAWNSVMDMTNDNPEWQALYKKRNLQMTSVPVEGKPHLRGIEFQTDLTDAEEARFKELGDQIQKEQMVKFHQAMDDLKKHWGSLWD